jgi:hypothetical protein
MRADLVFSYWIFTWYLLYIFKIVNYNPKFAILIGIIDNIIMLLMMIYFGSNMYTIFMFIIINTFLKILPYYTLWNEKIERKDILVTLFLFIIFIIWLYINKQNLTKNHKEIIDSLLHNKNKTPALYFISKVQKYFQELNI